MASCSMSKYWYEQNCYSTRLRLVRMNSSVTFCNIFKFCMEPRAITLLLHHYFLNKLITKKVFLHFHNLPTDNIYKI